MISPAVVVENMSLASSLVDEHDFRRKLMNFSDS